MTYRQLYLQAKRRLEEAGVDSPGSDALALTEFFFGLDRAALALRGEEEPSPQGEASFLRAVEERQGRRPLQYILGSWEFLGLSLAVGEGVLCPREDTAVLVTALAERLKGFSAPRGLDLCAGTGAVGLGLCSLLPDAKVFCVECSEDAFSYLERNAKKYPQFAVTPVRENILLPQTARRFAGERLDFIAANPPYVPTGEIASLQPEVQKEPALALDGGQDGLVFYRGIAELWIPLLRAGGVLAVEIGEDQAADVSALFAARGMTDIQTKRDMAGLDRCVTCVRPK